jgi:SNF2 family DNA or RNA helicase
MSDALPTGQLEVWPEYWLGGKRLDSFKVSSTGHSVVDGYRFRVPKVAQQIDEEYHEGRNRIRLRPRAVAYWLQKYDRMGLAVLDTSGKPVRVAQAQPEFNARLKPDDSLAVTAYLATPEGVEIDPARAKPIPGEGGWFRLDETFFERPPIDPVLDSIIDAGPNGSTLAGDAVPEFLEKLDEHKGQIRHVEKDAVLQNQTVFGRGPIDQIRIDGDDESIAFKYALLYSDENGREHVEDPLQLEEVLQRSARSKTYKRIEKGWVPLDESQLKSSKRHRERLPSSAAESGRISGQDIPDALSGLAEDVRRSSPWNVWVSERVKEKHRLIDEKSQVNFQVSVVDAPGGERLIHLDPQYLYQNQKVRHKELGESIRSNDRWLRRPRVWIRIDRDKFEAVRRKASETRLEESDGGYVFNAVDREKILAEFQRLGRIETTETYAQFLQQLATFQGIAMVPPPRGLAAPYAFYSYQQHGFNWLSFLRQYGLNGILADDMGLGKTLQTLAAIQHSREINARGSHHPSLIVCPVSVMANWEAEARRFFPAMNVVKYRGANRDQTRQVMYHYAHLVITSYTVAANDADELNEIPWNYVVLDEAHAIKNPSIQRTKKLKNINGTHKLALTGTPVQNGVTDLWSLFDFLMPGYLGSLPQFKAKYPGLFEKRTNYGGQASVLRERTHPFVMRRLKSEVAKDLPEKIVADRVVELSEEQERRYKELLGGKEAQRLRQSVEKNQYKTEGVNILALISKLRSICNHPALESNAPSWTVAESAKLEALQELMAEVVEGGHRALIFSQSTKMLDIIESLLPDWSLRYLRIDGSTPQNQRQVNVDTFNGNAGYQCMLLSTRAGGLGVNLTGADTVIFYDHDWNPSNDEQAQDRAYRIGQARTVTVYRLITKGTIEQKILTYQERKKALAQAVIGVDEQGFKNLSREELLNLFKLG